MTYSIILKMNLKQLQNKYNLSDLELFTQRTSDYKVSFIANKLKQAENTYTSGSAIRLIHEKKIGFYASYGKCNIEEAIVKAQEVSKFSPEVDIKLPQGCKDVVNHAFTSNNEDIFSQTKEKGNEVINRILDETKSSSLLVDVSFDISNIEHKIENGKGLNYSHLKSLYSFSVNIRETEENDFIEIFTAVVDDNLIDHSSYVNELLRFYKLSKKHSKIKTGPCPVLFTSKASKDLLNIVEVALNSKEVNQKSSPWHDKKNKKVLSNLITIKQDPDFGYMAREVDDEGNKVQTLSLIKDGMLENFYYDLLSASRDVARNASMTGNGFKPSLSSQPEPTLLNIIVSKGERPLDKIIKDIKYGLLIDQTMGGLTTNISGDMSVNVDIGFLIENGELVGRVKDTMVSGNIYTALNNVLELSNNPRWYWSNIYNPDMLIDGFMVTSK